MAENTSFEWNTKSKNERIVKMTIFFRKKNIIA